MRSVVVGVVASALLNACAGDAVGLPQTEARHSLAGTVSVDEMSLSVASVWPSSGGQADTIITYEQDSLHRGAAPDFSGYACPL